MGKTADRNLLKESLERLRSEGKKIVFTNGCFDIIHIGHTRYLSHAKTLGDVLVVGLNSDKSVSAIKSGRPVNPQEQRAEVLSSLEMVDYVTIFDEDTPYELIKLIQPDVLVKGGDWKKEEIVGSDIAKETFSLPYVRGVSTTQIIRKISKLQRKSD
jgi:rfaE bifunctional protein nucleotidyltransferase chain/domain